MQKLLLRSRSNTLVSVRRVTERNAGRLTAGVDGEVALTPKAKSELVLRVQHSREPFKALPVRRVCIPKPVLRAEINRLVRALAPYGVLRRDVLRRDVGAGKWHEPWFERALKAAVEEGEIEALPLGFYGLHRSHRPGEWPPLAPGGLPIRLVSARTVGRCGWLRHPRNGNGGSA